MEKEELDKKKMQVDMCRFRIGDIVQIPKEMLDEYKEEKSIPEMIPAKVKQLCKNHIPGRKRVVCRFQLHGAANWSHNNVPRTPGVLLLHDPGLLYRDGTMYHLRLYQNGFPYGSFQTPITGALDAFGHVPMAIAGRYATF